jgi:hypothetical protein
MLKNSPAIHVEGLTKYSMRSGEGMKLVGIQITTKST